MSDELLSLIWTRRQEKNSEIHWITSIESLIPLISISEDQISFMVSPKIRFLDV